MKMNNNMICTIMMILIAAMLCCGCAQTLPAANSSVANDQGTCDGFALSHSALELPLTGANGKLYAFGAEDPSGLVWSIEDSSVAQVSGGRVTPVAAGTTVITCTDGVNTASCQIIVSDTEPCDTLLKLSANQLSVAVGDTGRVEYTYTGPGAITIFSSDPEILRVEKGCWEAVAPGTAYVTCTDGVRHAQCVVTVTGSCG